MIKAIQYEVRNDKNPLLPPNQFVYVDGHTILNITDPKKARSMYNTYAGFFCNRYNRRNFVDGALYTDFFEHPNYTIYPNPREVIELDIAINKHDEHSFIRIFYDMNAIDSFLNALNNLG